MTERDRERQRERDGDRERDGGSVCLCVRQSMLYKHVDVVTSGCDRQENLQSKPQPCRQAELLGERHHYFSST